MRHHKVAAGLATVIKGLRLKDGMFTYTSDPMWDPTNTTFTNNIKADHNITITSDDGGVNITGYVGGKDVHI